jgi:hypothetical protein
MQITLINVTQIYIHIVQPTVNYSWNFFAYQSTTIMLHFYNIQTEVIVWYIARQRPKHAPNQDALSILIIYVSTKYYFITETYNYTKRNLQSHTDHYPNTRAMKWKKITTEELNKSIACHRSKQMKNKSHMLVRKIHQNHVHSSKTLPGDNFQLNLTCFHMVAKKNFATVLDSCWRSVVFITPPPIWPRGGGNLYLLIGAGQAKQLV